MAKEKTWKRKLKKELKILQTTAKADKSESSIMFSMIGKKGGKTVGIGHGGKNLIKKKKRKIKSTTAGRYNGKPIKSEYGGVKLSNKS